MSQRIKPIPITLDKPRTFLCDVNALIDLGRELGVNMMTPEAWEQLFGKTYPSDSPEAVAYLEKVPKAEIKDGKVFVAATPSFDKLRVIVWALLRHEDETLTLRQVGAMIDPANLATLVESYQKAIAVSQGAEDDSGANSDPKDKTAAAAS